MSWISRNELWNAYDDCMRRKRGTTNAIDFEVDDNVKLESLYKELNSMQYKIGKSIVFTLLDDKGEPKREVFAADFKDRIVHHLLINRLMNKFETYWFIDDNYSCRKNKGVLYGVKRCQEKLIEASDNGKVDELYIFKGDLTNCFNSLSKTKIFKSIEKFILENFPEDKEMIYNLYLLKLIIFHCPQKPGNFIRKQPKKFWKNIKREKSLFYCDDDHGIAVGNLTSQIFANFLLGLLDLYITKELGCEFYGRYVDDFYIFHKDKEKLKEIVKKIRKFLSEELDMELSKTKIYFQHYSKGLTFIGYNVHYNSIYVKKKTISKFEKLAYDMERMVENKYGENEHISLIRAERMLPSWNSYIAMFTNEIVTKTTVVEDVMSKHDFLISKMKEVFDFDCHGYVRLNKEMKQYRKEKSYLGEEIANRKLKWRLKKKKERDNMQFIQNGCCAEIDENKMDDLLG